MTEEVRPHGKKIGLLWIIFMAVIAFFSVGGLSFLARQVPMRYEKSLADAIGGPFDHLTECQVKESKSGTALQKLIDRIYPLDEADKLLPVSIHLVRRDDVNALAFLGGDIYLFDGLIKQAHSAEEVAGILAHELEHVRRRHVIQGIFSQVLLAFGFNWVIGTDWAGELARQIMSLKFTSAQEEEADQGAVVRLNSAKVDAGGVQKFFERLEKSSGTFTMLSDHPSPRARAQMFKSQNKIMTSPVMSDDEWLSLKSLCD